MNLANAHAAPAVPVALTPTGSGVSHGRPRWMSAALAIAEDVGLTLAVVLCVPVVILAIGMPVVLIVRLLWWIARLM